nr:hypothetical protein CFP56_62243 [Quercus suber]
MGESKRTISWGKQPIVSRPDPAHQPNRENGSGQPSLDISSQVCFDDGSVDLQHIEWVTGEGSGTHEEEKGESPCSGDELGGVPVAETKSDEEPGNHKEEAREIQSSGERRSCSIVNVTKLDVPISGSDEHGTFVEAVLSADREPAQSPDVADRMLGQGSGLLVADTSGGDCSTTVDNSGCPVQVQSQLVVGSDLNFSIFEVGRGLIDSEVPRLNWDDSLFSDKGEEAVNPEVITPLALWDLKGFHDLISGSDGCSVEEVLEPSEWIVVVSWLGVVGSCSEL